MPRETKLYDTLEIDPGCADNQIRKAYLNMSRKWHPDKEADPVKKAAAEEKFKEISRAYEVLSDSETRARYDRFGEKGLEEGGGGGGGGMDPSDLFAQMMGMGGGMGGGRRREPKPKDIVYKLEVTLNDFYNGTARKLAITRDRKCDKCAGCGTKSGKSARCGDCNGEGSVVGMAQLMPGIVQQVQRRCPTCAGRGTSVPAGDLCGSCDGKMIVPSKGTFTVHIDKGMKHGDSVTFTGEGDQIPNVRASGDIVIALMMRNHPTFQRHGRSLVVEKTVTLADALCGAEVAIRHMDDRIVLVKTPPGMIIKPTGTYVVPREGMPVKGTGGADKGDLVLKIKIQFPETLSPAAVKQLRSALGPMTKVASSGEHEYETAMVPCPVSLEALLGREDDDDDDEGDGPRVHMGGGPQCAAQ